MRPCVRYIPSPTLYLYLTSSFSSPPTLPRPQAQLDAARMEAESHRAAKTAMVEVR